MTPPLYCDICNAESSAQVSIARWHDTNVCTDCLAAHEAMEVDEATLDEAPAPEASPRMLVPDIRVTAQWIIDTALEAAQAQALGDDASVAACLEAIATYAKNISDGCDGR